jgi:protein arginine N-methyltransferase 1
MHKISERLFDLYFQVKNWIETHPHLRKAYQQAQERLTSQAYFSNLHIHERMLADRARVDAYQQAIAKYVSDGDVVLDLGTGTGILAFFAALRQARQVYAIDHAEIIEVAKVVAALHEITNVTFLKAHSQAVTLSEKVDILVQEQMGSWIFNENMLESVLDLRDRLLKPGGKILPAKFELFVEPVQLKEAYRVPFLWEQQIHGIDFSPLQALQEDAALDHFYRDLKAPEFDYVLCQPAPLFTFDLATMQASDHAATLHYRQPVVRPGRLDGFCFYFRTIFDDEISFTTSPFEAGRTHHWTNLFYRVAAKAHNPDDLIEFTLQMADVRDRNSWSWRFPAVGISTHAAAPTRAESPLYL